MGIIAVVLYGTIWKNRPFGIPYWVILLCHAAMALGTAFGGWRIVRTMGHSLTKLQPIGGFWRRRRAGGGVTILAISHLGIPVSTTHTITRRHRRRRRDARGRGPSGGAWPGRHRLGLDPDHPRLSRGVGCRLRQHPHDPRPDTLRQSRDLS